MQRNKYVIQSNSKVITQIINNYLIYSVNHKKRATLFSIITPALLAQFYDFCTSGNRKKYSTTYLFNGLMTS